MLNRFQLPTDVVFLIVLWRLRMKLSLRDLAEILLLHGLVFSHEAIRDWEAKLAPRLTDALRQRRRGKAGRSWSIDETYIKVAGQWQYLYRAIDRDGNLVDVYLSDPQGSAAKPVIRTPPKPSSARPWRSPERHRTRSRLTSTPATRRPWMRSSATTSNIALRST